MLQPSIKHQNIKLLQSALRLPPIPEREQILATIKKVTRLWIPIMQTPLGVSFKFRIEATMFVLSRLKETNKKMIPYHQEDSHNVSDMHCNQIKETQKGQNPKIWKRGSKLSNHYKRELKQKDK